MAVEKMDTNIAQYILRYYSEFMSNQEKLTYRHLQYTMKATHGRSDLAATRQANTGPGHVREMLSQEPEVIQLATGGMDKFAEKTAKSVLHQHGERILLNQRPRCGALAKTPKARQCRFCGHDWHGLDAKDSHELW